MRLQFGKYQATGNDFVLVEDWAGAKTIDPTSVSSICDRHFGVGADGLIVIRQSQEADFEALFYNPDGSLAEVCGNGLRCTAAHWYARSQKQKEVTIETASGLRHVRILDSKGVSVRAKVDLGPPAFEPSSIPMAVEGTEVVDYLLEVAGQSCKVTCLSVGNPHCVVFVDDIDEAPVQSVGPQIERHPLFPNRTNVEFVQVAEEGHLRVRVWERGVGETLACGTGAAAATAAAIRGDKARSPVGVDLPGGKLAIEWLDGEGLRLSGHASLVFKGELDTTEIRRGGGGERPR